MRYIINFLCITMWLITASVTCFAMEPFFKGQWGMSPDEIAALHNVSAPVDTDDYDDIISHNYTMQTADGRAFETTYYFFNDDDGTFKLHKAWTAFTVEDLDLAASQVLTLGLVDALERELKANGNVNKRFNGQPVGSEADGYQKRQMCWLNDTTCAGMVFSWHGGDDGSGLALDFDFFDTGHAGYRPYYDQVVRNLEFSDMQ